MAQQGVSKHISKLEEDLGFRLFTRTHHFVSLTKAGEDYYEMFSFFARVFRDTLEKTKKYYIELYKSLHIGYLEWLNIAAPINNALGILKSEMPDLKFFGERHPQYELNKCFTDKKVDMIITYEDFSPKINGLKRLKILETGLVLLVSNNHPLVSDDNSFNSFRKETFIKAAQGNETAEETKKRAKKQCSGVGFNPVEIIVTPNLESAYTAVELGQGVLISTELSRMSINSGLRSYPINAKENLICLWHEDKENPIVAKFADYLQKVFKENPLVC